VFLSFAQALRGSCDRAIARFRYAETGIAAVEFALILPVLLVAYVYLVEFYRAFDENRKVAQLATTLSDLMAQQPTGQPIPSSTVSSMISASASLVAPFGGSGLQVTISVVNLAAKSDGSCCNAKVAWSFTQGGTLRPCGVILQQVPTSVPPAATNIMSSVVDTTYGSGAGRGEVVVVDVHDGFQPIFTNLMSLFTNGFGRTAYMLPRSSGQLVLQSASPQQGQQAQICS
jgi:Flp pilus assembly protein TadG